MLFRFTELKVECLYHLDCLLLQHKSGKHFHSSANLCYNCLYNFLFFCYYTIQTTFLSLNILAICPLFFIKCGYFLKTYLEYQHMLFWVQTVVNNNGLQLLWWCTVLCFYLILLFLYTISLYDTCL